MRKEQLIRSLVNHSKRAPKVKRDSAASRSRSASLAGKRPPESKIARQIRKERLQRESLRDLALVNDLEVSKANPENDRVILIVRDSYWLQAYWEITKATVQRARVAMANLWYESTPVLRLLKVSTETSTSQNEEMIREIPVHGGVRNWFIDVSDPSKSYCVALGYSTSCGKFHLIAKSNSVVTPPAGNDSFDNNWADITQDYKKYYAMSGGYSDSVGELQNVFEDKLRAPNECTGLCETRLGH